MARLRTLGAELNSTTAGVELSAVGNALTIVTSPVRSGTYAWRTNTSSQTSVNLYYPFTTNQSIVGYQRIYFRIASLPSAATPILWFYDTSNALQGQVRCGTTGALSLRSAADTIIGSATAAMSTNTWIRLELFTDATTNPGTLTARWLACDSNGVDPGGAGTQIATGANSARGAWARCGFGAHAASITQDLYFDDWAINDASGGSQTSWPGSGKAILLTPNGDGDSHQWLDKTAAAGTSNNYQNVDEIPPNDATDYVMSGASGDTASAVDMYTLTNSGIGSADTVNVVSVSARHANITAADATTALKLQIEKTSSGTKTQSAAVTNLDTVWRNDVITGSLSGPPRIVTYVDPDGAAWTQSTLDSAQAGQIITASGTNRVAVSAIWVYVDYTPSPDATITAPPMTATASMPVSVPSVAITAPPASATASAPAPLPTLAITVPPASATASLPVPVPTLSLTAPPATATASAPTPVPKLSIVAPPATATASMLVPTVSGISAAAGGGHINLGGRRVPRLSESDIRLLWPQ